MVWRGKRGRSAALIAAIQIGTEEGWGAEKEGGGREKRVTVEKKNADSTLLGGVARWRWVDKLSPLYTAHHLLLLPPTPFPQSPISGASTTMYLLIPPSSN